MGNTKSVFNAFQLLGETVKISDDPGFFEEAEAIILPGVGSFADGMENLRKKNLIDLPFVRKTVAVTVGSCRAGDHVSVELEPLVQVDRARREVDGCDACVGSVRGDRAGPGAKGGIVVTRPVTSQVLGLRGNLEPIHVDPDGIEARETVEIVTPGQFDVSPVDQGARKEVADGRK